MCGDRENHLPVNPMPPNATEVVSATGRVVGSGLALTCTKADAATTIKSISTTIAGSLDLVHLHARPSRKRGWNLLLLSSCRFPTRGDCRGVGGGGGGEVGAGAR